MRIQITPNEIDRRQLTAEHLAQAVESVRQIGFVILGQVIPTPLLDLLFERMLTDLNTLLNASDHVLPVNFVPGHLQQDAPPFAPYVFPELVANPWVIQVTHALLGSGVKNTYFSGNTNLPGSAIQPVHTDGQQLWIHQQAAHPAAALIINVAPLKVSEENGSIELWPGSHHEMVITPDSSSIKVQLPDLGRREKISPPVRGNTEKGDVLIRDNRLWHRGVPNHSEQPRPMIAMIHRTGWYNSGAKLKFQLGCESAFEHPVLDANAEFVDEPIDYLFRNRPYDYQESDLNNQTHQANKVAKK